MASRQHDDNCINCQHRHEDETFKQCVICVEKRTAENQFPGWEAIKKPA